MIEVRSMIARMAAGGALVLSLASPAQGATYYVSPAGDDGWTGTSWTTAKQAIQAAVDLTSDGDTVMVSNGVYATGARVTPSPGSVCSNRVVITQNITVQSVNGPDVTIIDGADALRCVFLTNGVLSGFTLTNGQAAAEGDVYYDQGGGGVFALGGVVSNCLLSGNSANNGGGAYGGVLNDCVLAGNTGGGGGGSAVSTLNNCTLRLNYGFIGGGAYGGMLTGCTLSNNSAFSKGGGAMGDAFNSCTLNDCTLIGNHADGIGGSGVGGGAYGCTLNNCILLQNYAPYGLGSSGGGASDSTLNGCDLTGNYATSGGGVANSLLSDCTLISNLGTRGAGANNSTLTGCILSSNTASMGGGAYGGTLGQCLISDNTATATNGGGAYNSSLTDCSLTRNTAHWNGGGAYGGSLLRCSLTANHAGYEGGGVAGATLENCLIAGNTAGYAAGGSYACTLTNCTIVGNDGILAPGGSYMDVFNNSIVMFNTAGGLHSSESANYIASMFNYSCTTPMPTNGIGNITNDPQFASAADSNFRLTVTSPCMDTGDNGASSGSTDLDGHPRIIHDTVDMGAYEFQGYWAWVLAVTNGMTNLTDNATGDGYPNLLKYATGSSATEADTLADLLIVATNNNEAVALRFNRNTNATDATLVLESASDPLNADWLGVATNHAGSWGGAPDVTETGSGNPVTVVVEDATVGTRIYRLRVSRP